MYKHMFVMHISLSIHLYTYIHMCCGRRKWTSSPPSWTRTGHPASSGPSKCSRPRGQYMYISLSLYIYTYIYIYMYNYMCVYVYIFIYTHIYIYIQAHDISRVTLRSGGSRWRAAFGRRCGMVWCGVVCYGMIWYDMIGCCRYVSIQHTDR